MAKFNSTIFRTIKDDVAGATTSIRLFGKTFTELKNTISSIKTNGLFKSYVINDSDVKCIEKYNTLIEGGTPHLEAMEQATKGASDSTAKMIKNANGNTIALNQMTLGAKAASVAMNVLSTVGNMLLITAITKCVEWLVTYNKRLEETRQEMIETGKEVAKLTEDLDGLIEQYRKLGEDGAFDNSDREQAYNIQQQINELLGDEVEYINLQNGEYKEQLELLKRLQHEKANDNYAKLKDAKDASEESLEKAAFKGWDTFTVMSGFWSTDKETKAVQDLLQQTEGMAKYLSTNGGASFKIDISNSETIVQSYEDMIKLRNILSKSYGKEIEQGGVLEDFYNNLVKKIDSMSDAVQKYKDAMSDYNINEAIVQFNEKEFKGIKGALIDSESAMRTWITSMMKSKSVTDGVQAELIALAKTWYPQYTEQINKAINAEATKIIQDNLVDKSLSGNIDVLKAQATALGLTEGAMMSLVLAEINFNKNNLNVSQKVSALKELATWAGVAQAKMNSIFTANSKSTMKDKTTWANANNVTINKYADKDGTHTYTYNGKTYSGVNAVNEALLNEAIQSQIDKMNNIKVPSATATSGGGGSSSSSTKEVKETFNWIETKISRLQREITNLGKKVSATYLTWTTRNDSLLSELAKVNEEIVTQKQAYEKYLALANSVGLAEPYKSLVQSGGLRIDTITDENLKEKIELYQDYYQKYLDALDAYNDGTTTLADLTREQFDLAASEYDSYISTVTSKADILNAYIDQVEARGHMVSKSYYEELKKVEHSNISSLQSKYSQLTSILNNAVANGTIKEGSEEYNNMKTEIDGVQQALIEANTALIEYDNTMRDLDWEVFDKIQDKISQITEETDFLIDLISDEKMFDGGITEYGQATMGLHAINYETYMKQSKEYGEELLEINKQLANDPNNWTLIERKQELIELQRESILAAQGEKDAIIDLQREAYDELLNSMDEIIQKRKDMMSQIKDMYDYEKTISEQVGEVEKYQKIIDSLQGMKDTEQGKSMLQKYEVSLKEAQDNLEQTEYEKYISDQSAMLDNLYSETEQWINERMDNQDQILREVMEETNTNIDSIRDTLEKEADAVGITLSDEMNKIFGEGGSVTAIESTISTTLTDIKSLIQSMVGDSDKVASDNIGKTNASSVTSTPSTPSSTPTISNTTNTNSSSSGNGKWGSWFIPKRDSYPKDKLKTSSSIVDRLKLHNFDSSQSARASYYIAMGGSGRYTGSSSQNRWMIEQMRTHGFAKGGTIGSLIKSTGEDGFVLARTGEEILSLDKIKELGFTFEKMKPIVDTMKMLPNVQSNVSNRTMDVKVDIGDIQMYGVNDPEQFAKQLKGAINNNSSVRKMLNDVTLGNALGHNSLTRYTR